MKSGYPEFVDASYEVNKRTRRMDDLKAALEACKIAEGHMHDSADIDSEYLDKIYAHFRDARTMLDRYIRYDAV